MAGTLGVTESDDGVVGTTSADDKSGVFGRANSSGWGVFGFSERGFAGVFGSGGNNGVFGQTNSGDDAGVFGRNDGGGNGVLGLGTTGDGVEGFSDTRNGVFGQSGTGSGLHGYSKSQFGIYARSDAGTAGFFEGSITVTDDIILANADCAEEFDVADPAAAEPGTVMVIGEDGTLTVATQACDSRVAGIVSGAGDYSPALVLDRRAGATARAAIALVGKVYCKVDADPGAIRPGDLLTTSDTPGHAMRVESRADAVGAILGKALQPLAAGRGLIAVLVTLH